MMRILKQILIVTLGTSLLLGCGKADSSTISIRPDQPFSVVATYSILGDWVQRVGGDRVQVTTLVGIGGDPHTYEPSPQDSVSLLKASLVFENGLEFEGWLDELYQSSGSKAGRVAVAREIKPREEKCACHGSENDPHVWQSLRHAVTMVEVIAQELSQLDPTFASDYRQRAEQYIDQLRSLDSEIRSQVQSIPQQRRKLVLTHNSFGYFADDYGFEVFSLLDSFSSEASDPSAMRLAAIINKVKEQAVPAIFAESTVNPKLSHQVAREAGISVVAPLYTDALGAANSPASDYLSMMRFNAKTITESLR
jgi:zinc/manganese transport system substrate-binding protein